MMADQKAVQMVACSVDQMVGLKAALWAVLTAALRGCLKGRLKVDYWDGLWAVQMVGSKAGWKAAYLGIQRAVQ